MKYINLLVYLIASLSIIGRSQTPYLAKQLAEKSVDKPPSSGIKRKKSIPPPLPKLQKIGLHYKKIAALFLTILIAGSIFLKYLLIDRRRRIENRESREPTPAPLPQQNSNTLQGEQERGISRIPQQNSNTLQGEQERGISRIPQQKSNTLQGEQERGISQKNHHSFTHSRKRVITPLEENKQAPQVTLDANNHQDKQGEIIEKLREDRIGDDSSFPDPSGYYKLLNLTPEATSQEIRSACKQKLKRLHPDRYPHASNKEKKALHNQFIAIEPQLKKALHILLDPTTKEAYDKGIQTEVDKPNDIIRLDIDEDILYSNPGAPPSSKKRNQEITTNIPQVISLKEAYVGTRKKINYSVFRWSKGSKELVPHEITIDIPPGINSICRKDLGDELSKESHARKDLRINIFYRLSEKGFAYDQHDLFFKKVVASEEKSNSYFTITHLDGKNIRIATGVKLENLAGEVLKFKKLGMPYYQKGKKKWGKLYVMFFATEASSSALTRHKYEKVELSDSDEEEKEQQQLTDKELFKKVWEKAENDDDYRCNIM